MKELGRWITNQKTTPFYVRKTWVMEKKIRHAEAKVCGLGQFIFSINGKKVGDHELDPGWTNYRKLIEYVRFDVTEYLEQGENVIGAEVGNGWFIKQDEHYTFAFPEFMPPNPNPYRPFGESLVFAMSLEVEYEDGTKEMITADETFETKDHPITMTNVYGSETCDGRLEQKGWCQKGSDASKWERASYVPKESEPTGELLEQFQPPIKVIHTYDGVWTGKAYDFGQNMSGILEFRVKGKAGDQVLFYPAEKCKEDGTVDQVAKGWCDLDSCITYIIGADDVWETYRMKFTYFAGRYMGVEKISASEGDKSAIEIADVKAHAISSAYETDGSFSCDDERYNQIYDMIEKTVEANMVSVHTDCPTIERFAWQEPNHLMAPSIFYMKNGKRLWEKFLLDMRMDQHTTEDYFLNFGGNKVYPGEGLMPSQCPCYIPNVLPVPGMGSFYDIIPWGSTCILGTYWHYQFYGDKQIVEDNYEAGLRYLEHLKTKVNEEGFLNHGLGDWGHPENELARENVETAFLYADTIVLAKFAALMEDKDKERELLTYAEEVKANYNKKLLVQHPEKGYWCYKVWDHKEDFFLTQAAEALPLFWSMVPEEKKEDVVKAFRDTLEEKQAFVSGEVGLPYVIQSAREYGFNELICQFILREEHPSYYAFVLDGETTLGEYWESNPRSHCHDMMGHIIEWYYNGIAGIRPVKPGFEEVIIRPYLPESIHVFQCQYKSVMGTILVQVKEENDKILLQVRVPKKVACDIKTDGLTGRGKKVEVRQTEE